MAIPQSREDVAFMIMIVGWVLIAMGVILWAWNSRLWSWQGILGAFLLAPGIYIELFHFIGR